MPRKKTSATRRTLRPHELAFLTGDLNHCRTRRDIARVEVMRQDPDAWLLFGDRTANQLYEEFPEHVRK